MSPRLYSLLCRFLSAALVSVVLQNSAKAQSNRISASSEIAAALDAPLQNWTVSFAVHTGSMQGFVPLTVNNSAGVGGSYVAAERSMDFTGVWDDLLQTSVSGPGTARVKAFVTGVAQVKMQLEDGSSTPVLIQQSGPGWQDLQLAVPSGNHTLSLSAFLPYPPRTLSDLGFDQFKFQPNAPLIQAESDLAAFVDSPFAYTISVGNATSVSVSGLPAEFAFDENSRTISGTPTTTGSYTILLQASNLGGNDSVSTQLLVGPSLRSGIGVDFGIWSTSPLKSKAWSTGGGSAHSARFVGSALSVRLAGPGRLFASGDTYAHDLLLDDTLVSEGGASSIYLPSGSHTVSFRARIGYNSIGYNYPLHHFVFIQGQNFQNWAIERLPSSSQGSFDDPDHDGVSNIEEYAFGLNPLSPESFASNLLSIDQQNYLNITYSFRKEAWVGVKPMIYRSRDLILWDYVDGRINPGATTISIQFHINSDWAHGFSKISWEMQP